MQRHLSVSSESLLPERAAGASRWTADLGAVVRGWLGHGARGLLKSRVVLLLAELWRNYGGRRALGAERPQRHFKRTYVSAEGRFLSLMLVNLRSNGPGFPVTTSVRDVSLQQLRLKIPPESVSQADP